MQRAVPAPSSHSSCSFFQTCFRVVVGCFRIFSNPENDTDETLTTSGVSLGDGELYKLF